MFTWLKRFFRPKVLIEPPVSVSLFQDELHRLRCSVVDNRYIYQDVTPILSITSSIEVYNHRLNQAIHALSGDIMFPVLDLEVIRVKRCHFYRNKQGQLTDAAFLHAQFVEMAIRFLTLYEEKSTQPSQPLEIEVNLYRLRALMLNVQLIASHL